MRAIFPALWSNCREFWLVHSDVFSCWDWWEWLLWYWFNFSTVVWKPLYSLFLGHYYTISTACGFKITLSEAHLIFKITQTPGAIKSDFAHSSLVRPGDHIAVHSRYGRFHEQVTSVSVAERHGAFAPVTEEGTMLVDNVWVSCYADIANHDLAHTLMTPLKRLYSLAPHVLGSRGKYVHGYLRGALRPIGVRIFGEEKFYQSPQNKALVEYTDLFIESLPIDKNNKWHNSTIYLKKK